VLAACLTLLPAHYQLQRNLPCSCASQSAVLFPKCRQGCKFGKSSKHLRVLQRISSEQQNSVSHCTFIPRLMAGVSYCCAGAAMPVEQGWLRSTPAHSARDMNLAFLCTVFHSLRDSMVCNVVSATACARASNNVAHLLRSLHGRRSVAVGLGHCRRVHTGMNASVRSFTHMIHLWYTC
jgi:hypothetical protein